MQAQPPSFFSPVRLAVLALGSASRAALVMVCFAVVAFLAGCNEPTEARGFSGISGDHIGDDYVYYPKYKVYYMPAQKEYVYNNGTVWVRTKSPTNEVWARDIATGTYVKMPFRDSPELHNAEVIREYPEDWVPPEAVPGVPARTTNDDVRDGKR